MIGFDDHKVVTSRDLVSWLNNVATGGASSIWQQMDSSTPIYTNKTLRKIDITGGVWATYSPDENTTGIYISGYTVGDGKSAYSNNQDVIAADIAYREYQGEEPPPEPPGPEPETRVFKVYLKDDPDETNKGYMDTNTAGETVTFVVRTLL